MFQDQYLSHHYWKQAKVVTSHLHKDKEAEFTWKIWRIYGLQVVYSTTMLNHEHGSYH